MKNFKHLLVFLGIIILGFSGCKRRSGSASGDYAAYDGPVVKNDWKVQWLTANPEGLNPIVGNDGYAQDVYQNIFDTLLTFDVESGEAKPRVAERWEISKDEMTYDFYLRKDVKFHDGKPLTAEDIKFTYDILMNPKTDSAALRNYLADIKECQVMGPHHVRYTMKRPYFRNLIMLGLISVLPKHVYSVGNINTHPANRAPIGSGPYKFSKWDSGRSIELDLNADYWGNQVEYFKDLNNFKRILFRVITDQAVAALALKKGDIDVLDPTPTQFLKDFKGPDFEKSFYRIKYSTADGNGYRYIAWNLKKPLFQSKEVRQALAYAMPRDQINKSMFEDLLTPSVGPFPVGSPKVDPSVKAISYDKEKAIELLAQAGWKTKGSDGILTKGNERLSFQILFGAGSAEGERIALVYQQSLRDIGVEMNIRTLEWTVFLKQRQERKFDAIMMSWTSSLESDPYQIWHSTQEKDGGSNAGAYANKRVDEIMEKARMTLDRETRNKLYQEMSVIIADEQPYLFLFERPHLFVGTKRFERVLPVGLLGLDAARWFTPPGREVFKGAQLAK